PSATGHGAPLVALASLRPGTRGAQPLAPPPCPVTAALLLGEIFAGESAFGEHIPYCHIPLGCGPGVGQIAVSMLHLRAPDLGLLLARSCLRLIDFTERSVHSWLHPAGVAADVDDGPVLDHLPDLVRMRRDLVLHVDLGLTLEARERRVECGHTLVDPGLQLLLVEGVVGIAAAKEQKRLAELRPLVLERRALLEEPAERCDTGPRPD